MKPQYIIESIGYNVMGDELEQILCQYNGKISWAQPWFQKSWTEITFDCELDALTKLRAMYPDRLLTVLEDTGKIVSTYGHESGLTSMIIKRIK